MPYFRTILLKDNKMRVITKEFNIYTFNDAPKEVKEKIIEMFRACPYHYQHHMDERIKTLKKLAEVLDGDLDYSLSCVPDRGEFIKIRPKYDELNFQALLESKDDCPLTGVCYDDDILDCLKLQGYSIGGLNSALNFYIKSIHDEYDDMVSEEYLKEHCEANEYEFNEDGNIHN